MKGDDVHEGDRSDGSYANRSGNRFCLKTAYGAATWKTFSHIQPIDWKTRDIFVAPLPSPIRSVHGLLQ